MSIQKTVTLPNPGKRQAWRVDATDSSVWWHSWQTQGHRRMQPLGGSILLDTANKRHYLRKTSMRSQYPAEGRCDLTFSGVADCDSSIGAPSLIGSRGGCALDRSCFAIVGRSLWSLIPAGSSAVCAILCAPS